MDYILQSCSEKHCGDLVRDFILSEHSLIHDMGGFYENLSQPKTYSDSDLKQIEVLKALNRVIL